ncbi:MAG: hypothetical protein L6V95_04995 [Candidatus Melainabacteria bacterium]|nr:MAG: hypothetical protein L6V95_04995 [Candidatus Melainabacteria bacterium]
MQKNDVSRGFLIMKGDVFEETKTSFVKMYIGGVINSYKKIYKYKRTFACPCLYK